MTINFVRSSKTLTSTNAQLDLPDFAFQSDNPQGRVKALIRKRLRGMIFDMLLR